MGVQNPNSTAYQHPDEPNLLNLHRALAYNAAGEPSLRTVSDIQGDIIISGNVTVPTTIDIGVMPEVEIKNDLDNPIPVVNHWRSSSTSFAPMQTDAFGRLRVSQPYTLFDSQNQEGIDAQFSTALTGGGAVSFDNNESSVLMTVSSSGDSVVRQSFRRMSYQPGKSLLFLATTVMGPTATNLRQRVGYFDADDGVFFQSAGGALSLVLRSSITGTTSDARSVPQSQWNGDRLDGTGGANNPSGLTLDAGRAQIFWADFEWLGVGSVRCGFVINGAYHVCHTFHNANVISSVYMRTATLPVRYEITATGAISAPVTMKQICSTVMSEGGYSQVSVDHVARMSQARTGVVDQFVPLVSIRLSSTHLGSVILPNRLLVMPTTQGYYEVALIKNATLGGTVNWSPVPSDADVEFDVSATSLSAGTITQLEYLTSTNQSTGSVSSPLSYNWSQQLGVSLAGVSDVYTLAVRQLSSSPTASVLGALSFYDLSR
jgi:hypothetical protein